MKKYLSGLFFLMIGMMFISFKVFSGSIDVKPGQNNELKVNSSSFEMLQVTHQLGSINTLDVATTRGTFTRLIIPGYSRTYQVGSPELPVRRDLIEIPLGASVSVKIISSNYSDFDLNELGKGGRV